eukprot:TRINITY_DN4747_c0_g2_i2.p1 TRINITY_DN4747_c0_g2~~TRINITY_DN4747_c0_g2_i2.p1  ORF type:complete len:666 (+),score=209.86 TRINITY_DN4747_c0_g2_i2:51-2048(+)
MAPIRRLAMLLGFASGASGTASPISKVLELLGGMEEKTKTQGLEADKAFEEASAFCRRRSDDLGYSIKTNTNAKEDLEAKVAKASSKLESIASSLQETLQGTEANKAELAKATEVREKEKADFAASEKDLLDTMDSLKRAVGVLEKEATQKKEPSESLLQVQQSPDILSALEVMVSGSLISSADRDDLAAFLQSNQVQSESKKGSVVEMLEDLQDKAKAELNGLRTKENESRSNYQLLRQSLDDQIKFADKEVASLKSTQAEESTNQASGEKELKETTSDLAEDSKELADFTAECRRKKEDYALESKERADELSALASAKEALKNTGGAVAQTYSFVQHGGAFPGNKVVQVLREAARKSDSTAISLLARRVGDMMRDARGDDVFASIKTMISNMISKMEKSLLEDTDKAAQCDKDMKAAKEKLAAKTAELSKYQNRIDQAASKSAGLKADVSELQKALSALAEAKASATKVRNDESKLFKKSEPEIQEGLEGVKMAMKVLRDYYGKKDGGAATGILGMLEVVESDFAKNLAQMRVAETTAADDFKKDMEEMKLEGTRKEQDMKYKTEAHHQLDADLAGLQSDAESAQSMLEDEKQYAETIKAKCVVTPESFEEKRAKRQQEIEDLKNALVALDSSNTTATSLVQKQKASVVRQLRGSHAADAMDH